MNRLPSIAIAAYLLAALAGSAPGYAQPSAAGQAMPHHPTPPVTAAAPPGAAATGMAMDPHQMMQMTGGMPTLPGQDAFGALQEIVAILQADPHTDWSKVNLDVLREHLIDMNEVTVHADAQVQHIEGGIEVAVTGSGRTLKAIQRMVPDQAEHLDGKNGWNVKTRALSNGVVLNVTASDAHQVAMIRGLGFAGVLASGGYHQMHHLAMAKGEFMHGMAH
jgi:hypothetical protein